MYFTQALKAKNNWWRYLITILVVFVTQYIFLIPLFIIVYIKSTTYNINISEFIKAPNFELIGISQNTGLILLVLPSVVTFFVLWFMMLRLHHQNSGNIFSATGKFRWNRLWAGIIVWLILTATGEYIAGRIHPGYYVFHFDAARFIPLVIISFLFIPFQAGFEELLFRSYLMQGAGILFRYRLIALLLTSAAFGLMHSFNPEVNEFGFWNAMLFYMGFGIFAGLLVIFDNGIEMTIGVHTINNIFGCLFVTYDSSVLQTPALWTLKKLDVGLMNAGFFIMSAIFLAVMAFIFKWHNWKKIFQPIASIS